MRSMTPEGRTGSCEASDGAAGEQEEQRQHLLRHCKHLLLAELQPVNMRSFIFVVVNFQLLDEHQPHAPQVYNWFYARLVLQLFVIIRTI